VTYSNHFELWHCQVELLDVGGGNASSSIASGLAVEVANLPHLSVPQSPRPANVDAEIQSPI